MGISILATALAIFFFWRISGKLTCNNMSELSNYYFSKAEFIDKESDKCSPDLVHKIYVIVRIATIILYATMCYFVLKGIWY